MSEDRGALALLLHSHMPYVEGHGTWPFGEEWLWEAVAGVYLRLLAILDRGAVTVGLTPVLCDQLETLPGEGGRRFLSYLRAVKAPVHERDAAALDAGGQPELAAAVRQSALDYRSAEELFEVRGGDVAGWFAERANAGTPPAEVSLWSSAATHPILPLLATDAGLRLQLATGVASHERRFGGFGGGLWLPECAYEPGLERELAEHGVRAFCVDQTASFGLGAPEQLEPVLTAAGPIAVPLDWRAIGLVWDRDSGYPCSAAYRDYHRVTAHGVKAWANDGQPYGHARALDQAAAHARDFVSRVVARLDAYRADRRRPGLVCCALDTELLGHWWYEGIEWLGGVFEEAGRQGLDMVTLPAGLERVEPVSGRELTASSWGQDKDLSTWDSPRVAELVFDARRDELRTVAGAATSRRHGAAEARAARELLAVQASDWAFMVSRGLAADYPHERLRAHRAALGRALEAMSEPGTVPPEAAARNLAPDLDLAPLLAP